MSVMSTMEDVVALQEYVKTHQEVFIVNVILDMLWLVMDLLVMVRNNISV